ncbi:hypothetical protein DL766_001999 [Monosporascus sp. MC13-8B]|uniref:Yeast cell wall synthesis Kre9/Knh1-like N-terminal domain-containing protein n=1 Tax=Monosporascus cannonballus TaxID=155416 RepID=A0ABY0HI74_9PEZI|nr:hypothetical protein DL762_002316 [Monosporascus cannonballus]RYO94956.1 hypothetical protein DL763_003852 [Monosporascus cannonballus]RYP36337.1 hypothetical protein DL766_001999 [Monosporascus sp. MC13-8B]
MKFTVSSIILAGLAAATVILTNDDFSGIKAGEPFTITWADATGPVTITLKNGPADALNTVSTITSGQTGDSFTWTPSESLPSDTYALEISDGSEVNYSKQFQISGGAASGSSTVASSTGSTSATSATSTASTASTSAVISTTFSTSNSTTTSTASSESSYSATMSSNSSSITDSITTSSATTTMTTTRTSSRTPSTTTGTPVETEVPGANGAQGVVASLVAPLLVAVGAALF